MLNSQKRAKIRVFCPILLRKTRQRRDVTYDVIDKLRRLGLSKCFPVLCHKLIYEIAIFHSINGETCDKHKIHVGIYGNEAEESIKVKKTTRSSEKLMQLTLKRITVTYSKLYDNNCAIIIYEQEELEKNLTCKLLRAKFFGEKLALLPLNLLYPFKLSVQNTQNKKSRTTN